jgi:hypothetical protein
MLWKVRTSASRSKVRVAMEYGESAVFRCCGGDQRVSGRYAVVAVGTLGQLAQCARRGVGDGAVVAHDAQRVELQLERGVFGAGAGRVEDFHAHDRRDPEPLGKINTTDLDSRLVHGMRGWVRG